MRRKRNCLYGWTAFASITTVMLVLLSARFARAENEVKLNPFAQLEPTSSEGTQPAVDEPTSTAQREVRQRPTRIAPPANVQQGGVVGATPDRPTAELESADWPVPQLAAPDIAGSEVQSSTLRPTDFLPAGNFPDQWVIAAQIATEDLPLPPGEADRQTASDDSNTPGTDALPVPEDSHQADQSPAADGRSSDVPAPSDLPVPQSQSQQQPEPQQPSTADWWNELVAKSILDRPKWVKFDLETVLIDTLQNSPLIKSVGFRTSVANERIVQQDAAFDPTLLFGIDGGHTNEPVGNTLTTGGGLTRLREESLNLRGGFRRTTRHGALVDLTQQMGLLDSNSTFFDPTDQGNARLNLSLSQPLLARSGQVYNERLVTQAIIDHKIAWQDMRGAVERRIAEVMSSYWRLYELRCHLLQQVALLRRGQYIEQVVSGRADFDSSRVDMAKAQQRVARRTDRLIEVQAELGKQQARLATLIGSDLLYSSESQLEMIPVAATSFPDIEWNLRDAVAQGLTYRPEIRAATNELESAALEIKVTRAELVPQVNAIVDTYLAALKGDYQMGQSFVDQFSESGPGIKAGLEFEMPRGRRAARARSREAQNRYRQRSEELREVIQKTRFEIEAALIDVQRSAAQKLSKQKLLVTAIEEETVLTRRWEMMAGDGGTVGVVLENLLDAQQRRTDAEREWVTARSDYLISLIDLQRGMGTLLINEAITPIRTRSNCAIDFVRGQPVQGQPVQGQTSASAGQAPSRQEVEAFDQFLNNLKQPSTAQPQAPGNTEQP